jgi:hypothetical protein
MIAPTRAVQPVARPETQPSKPPEKISRPPVSGAAAGDSVNLSPAAAATLQSHNSFEGNTKQTKRTEEAQHKVNEVG